MLSPSLCSYLLALLLLPLTIFAAPIDRPHLYYTSTIGTRTTSVSYRGYKAHTGQFHFRIVRLRARPNFATVMKEGPTGKGINVGEMRMEQVLEVLVLRPAQETEMALELLGERKM
jgi:hypothetical protein